MDIYNLKGNKITETIFNKDDLILVSKHRWGLGGSGYVISHKIGFLHRVLVGLPKNKQEDECDHINRDKLDNRKENLRVCSHSNNGMNISLKNNNSSGFKGVSWSKKQNAWESNIMINQKTIRIGYYDSIIDAAKAYNGAAKTYFKGYAWLNDVN